MHLLITTSCARTRGVELRKEGKVKRCLLIPTPLSPFDVRDFLLQSFYLFVWHVQQSVEAQMNLDTGAIFVTYPKTDAAADHFYNPVLLVTSWLIALLITLVSQKRDFLWGKRCVCPLRVHWLLIKGNITAVYDVLHCN